MAHKPDRRSSPDLDRPSGRRHRSSSCNRPNMSIQASTKPELNLVLCGSDAALKASVSKCFRRGKTLSMSPQTESSSECVMEEETINGHLVSLVQLPALSHLSEEEVARQTLNCVSLCDPGVHVFLLIVPDAPLTDEDKAEIEKVQKIFNSREHFMLLFTTDLTVGAVVTEFVKSRPESQRLIRLCGGQYCVMGLNEPENSRQIPELLDYIENMNTEPYSLQMYVKAQENRVRRETEEQYEELKRLKNENKELKKEIQSEGADDEADDQECLRIVLIGRTGSGKSATGNTILGRKEFQSQMSTDSVTTVCQKGVAEVAGRSVAVVDTPGLFDMALVNDQVTEEIVKCVSLSSPGPHVFVVVLRVGRFEQVDMDTVDHIKKIFGHEAAQFSIVMFTRGDELEEESIEDYVKRSKSAELQKLITDCGNRFLAFNNKEKQDKNQVIQLLKMIEELKNTNSGGYFTNCMFEEAEMSIKKRMEEILKEREREIQAQNEALKAKYEMEKKNLMKALEEEKQRAEKERMKIENKLREKEENLRKEFKEKEKTEQKELEIEKQKLSEEEKLRSEYQKIEEMKREMENQRLQYEKQQKEREEEDRKREEKYRQDQENMKHQQEHILAELQMKQEEEIKKRESEQRRRNEEEEEERQRWKRKMKEAVNDRKEIQEEIKRQQREWEDEKKRQMREREEEERKRKEKHEEQLREKQEELEKMRKIFEREREEERQKIEEERQKQRREREKKEREYEKKINENKIYYEQKECEIKENWERQKREDEERQEKERKRWKEMIEDLKQEREEEMKRREKEEKDRKEKEEKEREEMKQKHKKEKKEMKKKHKDEARKQAEESRESTEKKNRHVMELTEMLKEHQEQQKVLEKLLQHLKEQKGEEIKELEKEVEKLKNKSFCVLL